jgi:hypothetical protein
VLALLAEFASDMRQAKSINQIALSSGKAYPNVHAAATSLINEGILLKETIGHSHLCRLNLANDKTLIYISLLETMKRDALLLERPEERLLLSKIDSTSAKLGTLLAWRRKNDLLLVTTETRSDTNEMPHFTKMISLSAFLSDEELRSTISGEGTLLFGHALYVSLLKQNGDLPEKSHRTSHKLPSHQLSSYQFRDQEVRR